MCALDGFLIAALKILGEKWHGEKHLWLFFLLNLGVLGCRSMFIDVQHITLNHVQLVSLHRFGRFEAHQRKRGSDRGSLVKCDLLMNRLNLLANSTAQSCKE